MTETMKLLNKALELKNIPDWTRDLNLGRDTLAAAKNRGHLSPAIAGAIAEKLGFDAIKWIAVAALESEKDSACSLRMKRKFGKITALYLCNLFVAYLPRLSWR